MSNKIEEIIEELQDYVNGCKYQALSGNSRIIVEKDIIDNYIDQLRTTTPDEIRRLQKLISNRDAIIEDAKAKADAMLEDAKMQTDSLISDSEIMQQAYAQAQAIVDDAANRAQVIIQEANNDAMDIRIGAIQYTDEMLGNVQHLISQTAESASARYTNLINELQKAYDTVFENRKELRAEDEETEETSAPEEKQQLEVTPLTGELPVVSDEELKK